MTRRTTAAAIARAIRAARDAGLPVAAVEVQSGGVVRILVGSGQPAQDAPRGNSCDTAWQD